jgi:hypothetical protein
MSDNTYVPYKKPGTKSKYSEKEIRELAKCSIDPLYFIETFCRVSHPTKGAMPFILYDCQKKMIDGIHNYLNCIVLFSRQMGKTSVVAAYMLWFAMFNADKTILITANLLEQAMEILDRVRFAYEELPDYIRDCAVDYNKRSLKFSNGSKIICRATTPNAGRGLSISLLYCDEFAAIRPSMAEAFWSSIQPVLSTGGKCIVTSTPNNNEDIFAQLWMGAINNIDDHGNVNEVGSNGFKAVSAIWSEHPDRDAEWEKAQRSKLGDEGFRREHCCISGNSKITIKLENGDVRDINIEDLYKFCN